MAFRDKPVESLIPREAPGQGRPQSWASPDAEDAVVPSLRMATNSEKLVALQTMAGAPTASWVAWEQCRVLRTRLLQLTRERGLRLLLVTSAMAGEGKTLVAANMALSFSQLDDKRVLLMDADLRRPGLGELFGIRPALGLSDCLQNGHRLADITVNLHPNLDYVPTRPAFERSVELLNRQRMRELLAEAAAYDLVVIDSAPLSPIADTQVLARLVDGAVLVVRAGRAHFQLVRQAAELLQPKLVGAVLNGAARAHRDEYFYRYYSRSPERKP